MSLLGWPLLVVLGILTVGFPVLTLVSWERARGWPLVRFMMRAGLVLASQLAAVLLVAAALNDYGYFYGSWSDLMTGAAQSVGISTGPSVTLDPHMHGSAASAPNGAVTASSYAGYSAPALWSSKGRIESVTITGPTSQLSSHAFVFLPPQYFRPAFAHTRFTGVEVLTGYPSNDLSLIKRLKYQDVLLKDINSRRAAPMVLVMMRSSVTWPRDAECTDVPGGPQAETFFAQDVPMEISHHYRVKPTGWGAIGDSTGGYCSTKIAMMYPSIFTAAVSLSGYYTALHDSTTGSLWGGSQVVRHLNSPEWRLQHMPAPPVSLLVTTGMNERGPQGYADTQRFLHLVKPPLVVDSLFEAHGGHTLATWSAELPRSMSWLSAKLANRRTHA